ncbi:hypothetical protein [Tahibacter harae]|uniref:AlgX/AlgJ SGNH hydrolase-like domain-containing protein n=1 Tax=Tahibacter harae TaxID=2963937 RepID=A0ABT1QYK7_9GAMM|nr:hypothetical protein [Tahibacter harae]MCQ4167374.1 hypothetical protein [Tahibacter harae]
MRTRPDAVRLSAGARLWTTLAALFLLIPVLGMRLQSTERLELFHNRSLQPWPAAAAFAADPAAWFRAARGWLGDRVYPIRRAAQWRKRLLLNVFHTAPGRQVALGEDGYVFLTGTSNATPYDILENICLKAHIPAAGPAMRRALREAAGYGQRRGIAVDVVVLPTLLTLYPERLPESVPPQYRAACRAAAAGDSPLLHIAAPAGVHYVFPFRELQALRDDPGFFPQANWHASGWSVQVARDAYLAALGLAPPAQETRTAAQAPSEILRLSDLTRAQPVYELHNADVQADGDGEAGFRTAIAALIPNPRFITSVFVNANAASGESVLILSDSYGQLFAPALAGAFRSVAQITANEMAPGDAARLIEQTDRWRRLDRVILLTHDGGAFRVYGWTQSLRVAATRLQP